MSNCTYCTEGHHAMCNRCGNYICSDHAYIWDNKTINDWPYVWCSKCADHILSGRKFTLFDKEKGWYVPEPYSGSELNEINRRLKKLTN